MKWFARHVGCSSAPSARNIIFKVRRPVTEQLSAKYGSTLCRSRGHAVVSTSSIRWRACTSNALRALSERHQSSGTKISRHMEDRHDRPEQVDVEV